MPRISGPSDSFASKDSKISLNVLSRLFSYLKPHWVKVIISVIYMLISTVMSLESTSMLGKFVEGALDGIGYKVANADYLKGMLIMNFKKR
jgi:ABC-type multidrug transport system fused ATPase/permease subunit